MMNLAIALATQHDRPLEPGSARFAAFLDNLPANRRAPANEARINGSGTTAMMFGAFCLLPMQRLLLEASQPVHLGSRALDILIALVERHGEPVTKKELISRVWSGIAVVETNLAVHISALRRGPRDGQAGSRYLINIPRQGYCFVAAVSITEELPRTSSWAPTMERDFDTRAMLKRLIGSADEIRRLAAELLQASESGAQRLDERALTPLRRY